MIEKFQQGGQLDQIFNAINSQPEQALQQLIQSGAKPEDIVKIVQAGVQQGKIKPEIGQAILQAMQGQKVAARHGIKLNYVKSLKNKCAEGEEVVYYKKGGSVKCGCKKKEEGGEVKKDCGGSKMKKFKMAKGGQQPYINPNDTVHVNGRAYVLTNMNGTPVNKKLKFPKYEGKVEKEDRARAQKGDKDAKRRQAKAEEITAPRCGGKVKKHQEGSIITKFKMHRNGGSLNGIPFYQGGTSKGGIEKSDNTRVQRIPNDKEGVYEQIPINGWDFVPLVGTYREAQRLDQGDPNASKLGFATSMGMDLLGAGMVGPAIKATAKASRLSKLLKSRGFNKITEQGLYRSQPNTYMKVAPETIKHQYYNVTQPTVIFKQVPTVDVSGIALSPLVQTLRVPTQAMAH